MKTLFSILFLCLSVQAYTVPDFFAPFNTASDSLLGANDDSYTSAIPFFFRFYGSNNNNAYVCNNGLISFAGPVSTYTPSGLSTVQFPLISLFWTDIDTRGGSTKNGETINKLWYRVEKDQTQIATIGRRLKEKLNLSYQPNATQMLVATWYRVGSYSNSISQLNTFQCVLFCDTFSASYVIMNYGELQFSKNSGASIAASVGFSAGDRVKYVTLPGSNTASVLQLSSTSNVGVPGQWIFAVDTDAFTCCLRDYPGRPQLLNVPANITLAYGSTYSVVTTVYGQTYCTPSNKTLTPVETTQNLPCGEKIISRKWSIADICGNEASATQIIRFLPRPDCAVSSTGEEILLTMTALPVNQYSNNYIQLFDVNNNYDFNSNSFFTTDFNMFDPMVYPVWRSNRKTYRYDDGSGSDRSILYLYGNDRGTERSLGGSAASGDSLILSILFENQQDIPIQRVVVSYTGEQWKRSSSQMNSTFIFQYKVVTFAGDCCSQSSNGWTTQETLSFSSPIANILNDNSVLSLDGNSDLARKRFESISFDVNVPSNQMIYFRWILVGNGDNNHFLAIDDLNIRFIF